MANKIRRIGVLTSGGDAPGMNAAVRAVVRTALAYGIECIGIRRGWAGLISSDFVNLTGSSVGHILSRGGTILYTARSDEFMTEKGRLKAVQTCRMLGLDGIVAIGGDGTFRGALELSRLGIPVVGIPATIDNDIGCSNYTIGFDSACNTAIECIDKLRDTMQSHERCSVVEVMGRNAGFLALYVGWIVIYSFTRLNRFTYSTRNHARAASAECARPRRRRGHSPRERVGCLPGCSPPWPIAPCLDTARSEVTGHHRDPARPPACSAEAPHRPCLRHRARGACTWPARSAPAVLPSGP